MEDIIGEVDFDPLYHNATMTSGQTSGREKEADKNGAQYMDSMSGLLWTERYKWIEKFRWRTVSIYFLAPRYKHTLARNDLTKMSYSATRYDQSTEDTTR